MGAIAGGSESGSWRDTENEIYTIHENEILP